jgi:hypothetical protein
MGAESCNRCGAALEIVKHRAEDGSPLCIPCAEKERVVHVTDTDCAEGHEDAFLKARKPGSKKPYLEIKAGESLEHSTGLWRDRVQRVDREQDQYHKVIKDQTTGEVLHECIEPLSKHQGRGSARKGKKKKRKKIT